MVLATGAHCSFDRADGTEEDPPPAGPCQALEKTCAAADLLRECKTLGALPEETRCGWGCSTDGGAHCGQLSPGGGVLTMADLAADPLLMDRASTVGGTIDTGSGSISGLRGPGTGVVDGIHFEVRTVGGRSAGVFRVARLELVGEWLVRGQNALAIAANGEVVIRGSLELKGDCVGVNPGPGGFAGGNGTAGTGPGPGGLGEVNSGDASGGGGGGYGATGGAGGRSNGGGGGGNGGASGSTTGSPEIAVLAGGSGGGAGGNGGGIGGGGGGAIHIAANGGISLRAVATPSGINAGGCGGKSGSDGGGGGGGAGGAILLEGPTVELDGVALVVNGGGGGGADAGTAGAPGGWMTMRAAGGNGAGQGNGDGGVGGAAGDMNDRQGQAGENVGGPGGGGNEYAGGGGGGVGRIRIHTRGGAMPALKNSPTLSPRLNDPGTTSTTTGSANVR